MMRKREQNHEGKLDAALRATGVPLGCFSVGTRDLRYIAAVNAVQYSHIYCTVHMNRQTDGHIVQYTLAQTAEQ